MGGRSVQFKIEQYTTPEGLWMQRVEMHRPWVWFGRIGSTWARGARQGYKSNLCCTFAQARAPVERWPASFLLGLLFSQITSGLRPESLVPWVGLTRSCSPSPMQPLVLMDVCKPFTNGLALLGLQRLSVSWMSNFIFVASFPCPERYCLVSTSAFWWKCLPSLGKGTILWG